MLLSAVLLWALNITVTKYMFEHGWLPLAYATIRYFAAIAVLRTELHGSFWIEACLTFAGVALIAAGAGGGLVSGWKGDLLAIALAVTWASYTIAIAPLMQRYSPYRISAVVLALGWAPLALVSIPQIGRQDFSSFSGTVWLGFAYAVIGPLFLTNILWFTAV